MVTFAVRIFISSLLPLLLAGGVILFDRPSSTKERKLETVLIFLFAISVAGTGIANFFAHFFLSDTVAESIGWEAGSPFQLEVAFANLAMGVLGMVAVSRRDGFRDATVIAVTVFSLGATVVHIMDIVATGNLAPGNTLQNAINLARPALLIGFLAASRRAEGSPDSEVGTAAFERWRVPLLKASGPVTIVIAAAYGLGYRLGQPLLWTLVGVLACAGILAFLLRRSRGLGEKPGLPTE